MGNIDFKIKPPADFVPAPPDMVNHTVVHRFEYMVSKYPKNIAVKDHDRTITYRALNAAANSLARRILERCGPGEAPITFVLGHEISAIITFLAVLKAGRPHLSLHPSNPVERIRNIVMDATSPLIVTDAHHRAIVEGSLPPGGGVQVLGLEEVDLRSGVENLNLDISPDSTYAFMYTTGTTGEPKGIIHSHRTTLFHTMYQANGWYLSPSDKITILTSISYGTSRPSLLGALLNGGTLCMYDVKRGGTDKVLDWLQSEKMTVFRSTPSLFRSIFDPAPADLMLPHLRFMTLGGEVAKTRDVELFRAHTASHCVLINNLASGECENISHYPVDHQMPVTGELLPVGYVVPEKEVFILDENGNEVPKGEIGEIVVKSRYLPSGYWRRPVLSEKRFRLDPHNPLIRIVYTGDSGRWREDGMLEYFGRMDNMVKIRGYRVEVEEIEAALVEHPAVKDVAVVACAPPNAPEEKLLLAYIIPKPGETPEDAGLRDYLAGRLPDYMIPSRFICLDSFPINPNGKVDRKKLAQVDWDQLALSSEHIPPRNETEARLVKLWQEVLGLAQVGVTDNFIELGGNSLTALRLVSRIKKEFGDQISLEDMLQSPTAAQQADVIRSEAYAKGLTPVIPVRPHGSKPPFFCISPTSIDVITYHSLAKHLDPEQPFYTLYSRTRDRKIKTSAAQFVEEIRRTQPEGPYYLGGYSGGGTTVLAIAKQLQAEGASVGLVIMLDTLGPHYPKLLPWVTPGMHRMLRGVRRLQTYLWKFWVLDWEGKRNFLSSGEKPFSSRFTDWLQKIGKPSKRVEREDDFFVDYAALRDYPGKVVLLRAKIMQRGVYPDPLLGWGGWFKGGLQVIEIPGDHESILFGPHIPMVAKVVQGLLEAACQDGAG